MGIRSYKPTSPGRRFVTTLDNKELTETKPHKKLTQGKKRSSGRNNDGRITSRHRGGGHKKLYRVIDFKRNKFDVPATVATIEYDPNRSANIALLHYADGDKRYILAVNGMTVGGLLYMILFRKNLVHQGHVMGYIEGVQAERKRWNEKNKGGSEEVNDGD